MHSAGDFSSSKAPLKLRRKYSEAERAYKFYLEIHELLCLNSSLDIANKALKLSEKVVKYTQ